MKFSIKTILWAFALLASAMATFGLLGIAPTLVVLLCWLVKFIPATLIELLVLVALFFTTYGLLFPKHGGLDLRSRNWCVSHLEDLATAVLNFKKQHDTLPENFSTESGRELSWRVLVAPTLGHADICKKYGLNKTWSAQNEKALQLEFIESYDCPTSFSNTANASRYCAVIGQHTYWTMRQKQDKRLLKDSPSETILLMEASGINTQWYSPGDITYDNALHLLTTKPDWKNGDGHFVQYRGFFGFFVKPEASRAVAFADGSVRLLHTPLHEDLAKALLTANGGEPQVQSRIALYTGHQLDYKRIWSFILFCIFTMSPAFFLYKNEKL